MFCKRHLWQLVKLIQRNKSITESVQRTFLTSHSFLSNENKTKEVTVRGSFEAIDDKTKSAYLDMVKIYISRDVHRRGHVEFIYSALRNMESFSVNKDLDVYKAIMDVLPKGKFIPQNIFQAEFMHYPKQQQCAIDLLEQMEENGVMPDYEMEDMLMNIFGKKGYPLRKFWRMMYWMPKFKNLSPWSVPNPPPNDSLELARLAITRISSVDVKSNIMIYQTSEIADSIEDTWIVSSQSPTQKMLLQAHNPEEPIYVEGSYRIWLRTKAVNYFVLRANPKPAPQETEPENPDDVSRIKVPFFNMLPPKPKVLSVIPSVHEQDDGIIFSVCATGTSSKDSLLSWIRHLEKENPVITSSPIVFTLRAAEKELAPVDIVNKEKQEKIDER